MTPYLSCDAALDMLDAFVDGELPTAEQVAVESHLRWCRVCEARVADLKLIGGSLRTVAQAVCGPDDHQDMVAVQSSVLERVRAEDAVSVGTRFRALFVDMRLFWPALGATAAVAVCVYAALSVFAAATAEENQQSMAAMIEMLANPGSDENPLSPGDRVSVPRALDAGLVMDSLMDDDTVYALSAVVTREGRVSNSELLLSERASVRRRDQAVETGGEAAALLSAVRRSRFAPAQSRAGDPVAVNVVWLVARTTVKPAAARVELALPRSVVAPAAAPVDQKTPESEVIPGRQSGDLLPSTTA